MYLQTYRLFLCVGLPKTAEHLFLAWLFYVILADYPFVSRQKGHNEISFYCLSFLCFFVQTKENYKTNNSWHEIVTSYINTVNYEWPQQQDISAHQPKAKHKKQRSTKKICGRHLLFLNI